MLCRRIDSIYAENIFIVVKDAEFPKLESPHVGSDFELNGHRGVIVGTAGYHERFVRYSDAVHHICKWAIQYIRYSGRTPERTRQPAYRAASADTRIPSPDAG